MRLKVMVLFGCLIILISPLLSLAETINYTYDSLNRIVREERSNGAVIVYAYDSAGNRTSKVVSGSPVTTTTIIVDTDNDGISDSQDNCPNKPNGPNLGTCSSTSDKPGGNCTSDADCANGCSSNGLCIKDQRDADNDGAGDVCDCAPPDNTKFKSWSSVYVDADGDGHGAGIAVTICGGATLPAGYSTSNDDGCPNDPTKTALGICGCGVADTDTDADGIADCNDNCPTVCNPQQLDANGNGIGDLCDPDPGCGGCSGTACEPACS